MTDPHHLLLMAMTLLALLLTTTTTTASADPQQSQPIICSQPITFRRCINNWRGGGTETVCNALVQNSTSNPFTFPYYRCLCQQLSSHAYCFNAFCPADPTGPARQSEAVTACRNAGNLVPTISSLAIVETEEPVTLTSVSGTGGVVTSVVTGGVVGPSSAPITFPSSGGGVVGGGGAMMVMMMVDINK
ncbi:hypothetical protein HDU67_008786 [Dinochytrium kinnereticum]|nr:hypothetical protein HDU67_008786 [Dinochytrium kinnereticum]